MSRSSTPGLEWADPVARDDMDGGFSGRVTVTRARSPRAAGDLVSVESEHMGNLLLTQEQAAELAEVLREVSGMASAPRTAQYLAEAVREGMESRGRSVSSISSSTGISRYRLGLVLSGKRAMTQQELVAISNGEPA